MAPEILFPNHSESKNNDDNDESFIFRYSKKSDVWGFAMVMYELICRKLPFESL